MTSCFKPEVEMWSKLRMLSEKSPRRTTNSYRKSMLLNPFPVTDLQPVVELRHLYCACADKIVTKVADKRCRAAEMFIGKQVRGIQI